MIQPKPAGVCMYLYVILCDHVLNSMPMIHKHRFYW